MAKTTTIFIITLAIITALLGYNYFSSPFYQVENQEVEEEVESTSDDLTQLLDPHKRTLNQLSSEQKIGQIMAFPQTMGVLSEYKNLTQSATPSAEIAEDTSDNPLKPNNSTNPILQLQEFQPGVITFFGSSISYELAEKEISEIKQLFIDRPLQPLLAVDHEGGSVQRFSGEGFTKLPPWRQLCQETQMTRQEKLLESAHELLELDINIVFAPVLDLASSVLGNRSCADRRNLISSARNYIDIFGSRQIMPIIKHYPGLGGSTRDLHDFPDEIQLNSEEVDLFTSLMALYPTIGIMTSHAQVEGKFDGLPCSLSPGCVREITSQNLQMLVFSDALEMGALQGFSAQSAGLNEVEADDPQNSTESAEVDDSRVEALNSEAKTSTEIEIPEHLTGLARVSYLAIMAGNHVLVYGEGVEFARLNEARLELAKLYEQDEDFAQKVDRAVMMVIGLKKI